MAEDELSLDHQRTARRGVTAWAMLAIGGLFIYAGHTVDPMTNCGSAGECAPWLVPVAAIMGWCAAAMGLGLLAANPSRGCRIDRTSGDLLWWKNRNRDSAGDTGRIDPARIAYVRWDRRHENDSVSLYDENGERLAFFDEEVIPWPYDRWIKRLQQRYPHIRLDEYE